MTFAERFYLAALTEVPAWKCVHLADPQMNVFLIEAYRSEEAFIKYFTDFVSFAKDGGTEPHWHSQARQIIENR